DVDRVLQLENLAANFDGDLLRQVAHGDGRRDLGDVAHLSGEVRRHRVDGVGQVFPRTGDAGHYRVTAELTVGADLACDARNFRRERPQLIDHRVDGVLQLEDFAERFSGDLLRQIAIRDGRRNLGDVAHLTGEIRGHVVDRIRQVFPRTGDALDIGLPAELAFRADFASHTRDF